MRRRRTMAGWVAGLLPLAVAVAAPAGDTDVAVPGPSATAAPDAPTIESIADRFRSWWNEAIDAVTGGNAQADLDRREGALRQIASDWASIAVAERRRAPRAAAMFDRRLTEEVGRFEYGTYHLQFGHEWGVDLFVIDEIGRAYYDEELALSAYLDRLEAISRFLEASVERCVVSLAAGYGPPAMQLDDLRHRMDRLQMMLTAESLWGPEARVAGSDDDERRRAAWTRLRTEIQPALRTAAQALQAIVAPDEIARPTLGIGSLPHGAARYRHTLAVTAEIDRAPDELHAWGRAEVERIIRDDILPLRRALAPTCPEPEATAAGRHAAFRTIVARMQSPHLVPAQYFADEDAALDAARAVRDDVARQLDRLFSAARPETAFEVETHAYAGSDEYAGVFYREPIVVWLNTSDLDALPRWAVTPLILHEGVPGHLLQLGWDATIDDPIEIPGSGFVPGYGEGWAMYAEWLGHELGCYDTPAAQFGAAASALHRAARVVVDTGIHALNWDFERAVEYLEAHSALTRERCEHDVLRIASWPGQACAYHPNGQRLIDARRRAEAAFGDDFSVIEFHDRLLEHGTVPMDVAIAAVDAWIDAHTAGDS